MADTVNTQVIRDGGRRYVVHLTNESDGTGESDVTKVDISTITIPSGTTPTYTVVEEIFGNVVGTGRVVLEWDHTANDEIAVLSGNFYLNWAEQGGMVDPKSAGGTGDILLTTNGFASGDGYDITIVLRAK